MTKVSKQWDFDFTLSFPVGLFCLFPSAISSSSPGHLVQISMVVVTTQKSAGSNPQTWGGFSAECEQIRKRSHSFCHIVATAPTIITIVRSLNIFNIHFCQVWLIYSNTSPKDDIWGYLFSDGFTFFMCSYFANSLEIHVDMFLCTTLLYKVVGSFLFVNDIIGKYTTKYSKVQLSMRFKTIILYTIQI